MKNLFLLLLLSIVTLSLHAGDLTLLNVSYDPTREFYEDYNRLFSSQWHKQGKGKVVIRQSHGGSGKQARTIMDGLDADVVTLALAYDIDSIAQRAKLLPSDWQKKLPHNSAPYTSTIVFLVRKGNPKQIRDWNDLAKAGVSVITPNPKTSGGARWNYLAAWAYGVKKLGSEEAARDVVTKIFRNVPVLDSGARGATTTFNNRGIGDVLITWENEALLALKESGAGKIELVVPSISILAEPPVAVVEKVAKRKGNFEAATAYLEFLYSPEAQELVAKHYYRPQSKEALAKFESTFPRIELVTIDQAFGGWAKAQKTHFDEGGTFDKIFQKSK